MVNKERIIDKLNTFPSSWDKLLLEEKKKDYFINLINKVASDYLNYQMAPEIDNIYLAFKYTDINNLKLVILGQDPYPTKGVATGLAFGVNKGNKYPKSLNNIFKEIEIEYHKKPKDGSLEYLAKQGVLLLNTCLCVKVNKPNSCKDYGYSLFTSAVIKIIEEKRNDVIYLLFGNYAKEYARFIKDEDRIVYSIHPSPLSAYRGFFNSSCFIKTNEKLKKHQNTSIDFTL